MLWHCGSEGNCLLLLNERYSLKTEWNFYLSVCCSLDCDLLWCWINRWIRLWNEMICWFCFILLISSDNLSVGEESCESAIPWIRDLISFVVISILLSTGIWNDHPDYSFSFLLIRKQSLFNPSSQTRQFNSFITVLPLQLNPLIWRLNSFLFTMQLSIWIHNAILESSWNMNEFFHSVFSVSILTTPSKPIQYESHIHDNALNHPYSAVESPDITSTIDTQTNKSLSYSIHPRIRFA